MNNIDVLTEEFKKKLEGFELTCDSLDDLGSWDKEENGEMDVYFINELVSIILRLIAADGVISAGEADYLSKNFGFDYSVEELELIYENCRGELENSFGDRLADDIEKIRSVDELLVKDFKDLAEAACDILASSDGVVTDEEKKEIQSVMETLKTV